MEKLALLLLTLVVLSGCGGKKETSKATKTENSEKKIEQVEEKIQEEPKYYNYLDGVYLSNLEKITTIAFLTYDPSLPQELNQESEYIFLAKVISIDKAIDSFKIGSAVCTLGKLSVLENIKGTTPKEIPFSRSGGIIKVKDYYQYEIPSFLEKINRGREVKVQDDESYIEVREGIDGKDTFFEVGKTYFCHANFDKRDDTYFIEGFEYGALSLQENNEPINTVINSLARSANKEVVVGKSWEVKNESDGTKQNLAEYLRNIGIEVTEK